VLCCEACSVKIDLSSFEMDVMSDEEEGMCIVSKHPIMAYVSRHRGTCEEGYKKPKCGHKDKNREFEVFYKATSVNSVKDLRTAENWKPKWVPRKGLTPKVYAAYGACDAVETKDAVDSSGGPVSRSGSSQPEEDPKFELGDLVDSTIGDKKYRCPGYVFSSPPGIQCNYRYDVYFINGFKMGRDIEESDMKKVAHKAARHSSGIRNK
jgi:hypothetical protein